MKAPIRFALVLSVLALFCAVTAPATPITITDITPGTAINDGVVNPGEYVGASSGINGGFGDVLGGASLLHIDSDTLGNLSLGHVAGNPASGLNDVGVMYIDSVAGGFVDTTGFADLQNILSQGISATDGALNADLTFAPGFQADYALAWDVNGALLYQLANGGNGSMPFVANANLTPAGNALNAQWEMNLTMANLGLAPGGSFNYVVTYLNPGTGSMFRSDEFHGVAPATVPGGNIGTNPFALAGGDFNTFTSVVPEPSTLAFLGLGLFICARFLRRR